MTVAIDLAYLFAAIAFVLALRWMSHPTTARRGVRIGEAGMVVAVVATLLRSEIVDVRWIAGDQHAAMVTRSLTADPAD